MRGFIRHLGRGAALAMLFSLAACGGGSDVNTVEVSGTVKGLTTGSLSLTNSLSTVNIPANSTTFIFPTRLNIGLTYNVTVLQQPTGYTCLVANGFGTAGFTDTTAVSVACAKDSILGGVISGLTGTGLVLANGAATVTVAAGSTSFQFAQKVSENTAYGVTVLSNPSGQICSVTNGANLMGNSDVNSVVVTCQQKT